MEAGIESAIAKARATWPELSVDDDRFRAMLVQRGDPSTLHVADLYFALACALGDPRALAQLDERTVPELRAALHRQRFANVIVDETLQVVRETLLVSNGVTPPRILDYAGRGPLTRWLRVVSMRIAFRHARAARREVSLEAASVEAGFVDPELERLKKTYGVAFNRAFADAMSSLNVSDRLLLKQRYAMSMTVTELGTLHRVNASTITRRVADVRTRLEQETRRLMIERLELRDSEVESVLRLIQSQMDISLSSTNR